MKITFDPAKREATLKARDLDFAKAGEVFAGLTLDFEDTRKDYGETRMITVGHLRGRMVVVVWTERDGSRRIISMRKANAEEQEAYRQRLVR
jgi:uncharacterized DUF497 family protein